MKHLFYVGQRVKRTGATGTRKGVATCPGSVKKGTRGTVVFLPIAPELAGLSSRGEAYGVLWDSCRSWHRSGAYAAWAIEIEPVYDGDQKTEWSEASWVPMHMRKLTAKQETPATVKPEFAVSK
jgi:hypothetical protein